MASTKWAAVFVIAIIIVLALVLFLDKLEPQTAEYVQEEEILDDAITYSSTPAIAEVTLLLQRQGAMPSEVHVTGGQLVRLHVVAVDEGFNNQNYSLRLSGQDVSGVVSPNNDFSASFKPTHYGYYPLYWESGQFNGRIGVYVGT